MKIIVFVFLCLGLLFYLVMVAAMVFDKWEWVDLIFFLTVTSEGAALAIAVVMMFLNL